MNLYVRRGRCRPGVVLLAGIAAICLFAACGGDGRENPASIPDVPDPAPERPEDIRLPLDDYLGFADEQLAALNRARGVLTQQCMEGKGFEYAPESTAAPATVAGARPRQIPRYGINDFEDASREGYPDRPVNLLEADAETLTRMGIPSRDDIVNQNGVAWFRALYGEGAQVGGNSHSGCINAMSSIYDDAYGELDRELAGRLAIEAAQLTSADARVVKAIDQWSACMSEQGFSYQHPAEPFEIDWRSDQNAEEVATAIADVKCKNQTNLPGTWLAVERAEQQRLLERNAPSLTEIRDALSSIISMAERVAAQTTPAS